MNYSKIAFALVSCLALPVLANNLPTNGKFVGGTGTIFNKKVDNLHIIGNQQNNVIVWDSFDIGKNNIVNFSNNNYLNLVKGKQASFIDGKIYSFGKVFIVNPNGITIGNNAEIIAENGLGLSTAKISDKNIDNFIKSGSLEITKKGMGKVKLLGSIRTDNLIVDAGHIIIKDHSNIKKNKSSHPLEKDVQLVSSIKRIDIGGTQKKDLESAYNLSKNDGLITHFDEIAISSKDEFLNIKNDMSKDYWLCDDIDLGTLNTSISTTPFTGKLDGTFNTLNYTLDLDNITQDTGLFNEMQNASIKNLKVNSAINVKNVNTNVNIGALASSIESSNFENLIINTNANFVDNRGTISIAPIAANAKKSTKHNSFKNVETLYKDNKINSDKVESASFISKNNDDLNIDGYIAALSLNGLKAIYKDNNNIDIKTDKQSAKEAALKTQSFVQDYFTDTDNVYLKGFLKPFFTEDFTFEYDGDSHKYLPLIESKYNWFDIHDYFDVKGKDGFIDAGVHKINFEDNNKNYYFIDSENHEDINGSGKLTITKRQLGKLEIDNVNIVEGEKVPEFIVKNKDKLNFAKNDNLDSLGLKFDVVSYDGNKGQYQVHVSTTNNNYDFTYDNVSLIVNESNIKPMLPLKPAIKNPIYQTEITVLAKPRIPFNTDLIESMTDCTMCKNLDKLTELKARSNYKLSENIYTHIDTTLAQNTKETLEKDEIEEKLFANESIENEESNSFFSSLINFIFKDDFERPSLNEDNNIATNDIEKDINIKDIVDRDTNIQKTNVMYC